MLRIFSTIIIFFTLFNFILYSNDKELIKNETFKRLMLNAQPLPEKNNSEIFDKVPLMPQSAYNESIFNNVNLTKFGWSGQEQMQNESSIAINPKDNKNLISSAVDYRDNGATWVYVSTDGGKSWTNKNLGRPFLNWRASNDPSVAFDDNGIGYLVYGSFPNMQSQNGISFGENGVFISKTTDKGTTWKTHIPIILHKGQMTIDSTFEDKYYIQVDNSKDSPYFGHLYVPWKRVTPRDSATQIVISKSTDKGDTWTNPVNVSPRITGSSEDTTFGQSFPLCITGPKGEVYVVWNNGLEHGIGFAKSLDGGKIFTSPRIIHRYNIFGITTLIKDQGYRHTVKGKVRAESYPTLVCDISESSRKGYLYLCWAADNIPNIYFSYSSDGGDNWSNPIIIHSDTTNDQFWPWIALDRTNGNIAVMYLDSRLDKNNILVDCFVSFSSDGGKNWIDRRASDVSADLRNNPFSYQAFAGDYSGCAFHNNIIYPSWVDMRDAQKNTFDNDVFTAIININLPAPVDTIFSTIYPNDNKKVKINWDYKEPQRAFGQNFLSKDDYKYDLYRNYLFLKSFKSNEFEYLDTNLTPHEKINYSINVVSNNDSSSFKNCIAFPGGSKLPSPPIIVNYSNKGTNEASIYFKIPNKREDGTTPLVNVNKLSVFRDSLLIKEIQLSENDTSKIIEFRDLVNERGFYKYFGSISDKEIIANQSISSNEIVLYIGAIENEHSDDYNTKLLKYYNQNGWGLTNKFFYSPENSITDSPNGKYLTNRNYILGIFPVISKGNLNLEFKHVAVVHQSDSALIEYSTDFSNWFKLTTFNKYSYPNWDDGNLTKDDWKIENIKLNTNIGDTVYFRFRLYSNIISTDDGWYIDDLKITQNIQSIKENNPNLQIYPNPFNSIINIYNFNNEYLYDYSLTDMFGRIIISGQINDNREKILINSEFLTKGAYILRIKINNNNIYNLLIKE